MYHSVNTKISYAVELLVVYHRAPFLDHYVFLLYIKDLFRSSSKAAQIMLVDDTNLFISDFNIENLFETINEELRKVANCFKANKLSLSLSISKTKYSSFHSIRRKQHILHIANVPIKREFVTKFLRVYLDENIT